MSVVSLGYPADPRPGQPCAPTTDEAPSPDGRTAVLNAPVRSLKMLELQIAAGAGEVYLALAPPAGAAYSFDAMPVRRDGEPTHVASAALLRSLVTTAHKADLTVHFCADAPVVAEADTAAFLTHVDTGIDAGADTVVVGNPAACGWLADRDGLRLVAGGSMGISSPRHAAWLRDTFGVRRVVLPHSLTFAEVGAFCDLDGLEIETPVQTGGGLDCTRCRLPDTPGVGLACRAGYTGSYGHAPAADLANFLDGASDCALCDVPRLVAHGVTALQLPGRESPNVRQNAKVTQMYRRALVGHRNGAPITEVIEQIDRVELMWQMGWMPRLCDQHRCRFRDTPQQRAFV